MPQAVTRYAIIGMVLIGFAASVYACGRATDTTTGATKLEKLATGDMARMDFAFRGDRAPPDRFLNPDGQTVSLADFQGQTVMVNIWATFCAPCVRELPSLAALETARGSEVFTVIALSIDELEERDYARGELEKLSGGVLELYQAESLDIIQPLGVGVFPTTIIYDRDGREVSRFIGDADWAGYNALAFIDAVLAGD